MFDSYDEDCTAFIFRSQWSVIQTTFNSLSVLYWMLYIQYPIQCLSICKAGSVIRPFLHMKCPKLSQVRKPAPDHAAQKRQAQWRAQVSVIIKVIGITWHLHYAEPFPPFNLSPPTFSSPLFSHTHFCLQISSVSAYFFSVDLFFSSCSQVPRDINHNLTAFIYGDVINIIITMVNHIAIHK